MVKQKNKQKSILEEKREKLEEAKKNFLEIQRKIQPFIKKRTFKEYSTTGKWQSSN